MGLSRNAVPILGMPSRNREMWSSLVYPARDRRVEDQLQPALLVDGFHVQEHWLEPISGVQAPRAAMLMVFRDVHL
jgi:hypothetical protein